MLLNQMLRLTLTFLIASRNPKVDYTDDNESEICVQEKQISRPEGDCGVRLKEKKQLFPNIQRIVLRKKENIGLPLCKRVGL